MDISKVDCEAAKASAIAEADSALNKIENDINENQIKKIQLNAEIKICEQVMDMLEDDQGMLDEIKTECIATAKEAASSLTEVANNSKNNFIQGAYYAGQDEGNSNDFKVIESVGNDFTDTKIPEMEKAVDDSLEKLSKDIETVTTQKKEKMDELKELNEQIKNLRDSLKEAQLSLGAAKSITCPEDEITTTS